MQKAESENPPAVPLAKTSNTNYSLLSQTSNSTSWIVDTGAIDYMTGSLKLLSNFEPSGQGIAVIMADGTTSMAKGRGTAYISGLVLQSVLYVPNLTCNLLSVSKIKREKDCALIFSQTSCVFQDLSSRKMIGSAKERGGLYQISSHDHSTGTRSYFQSSLATFLDSDIVLWHQRLGHPNFEYPRFLYPSVSNNKIQHF